MELIRGLHNLKNLSGCVLTIGNFDGVHAGHQEILKKLVKKSKEQGLPSLVISFSVCLLYTSPSPRDRTRSRMPSSA